MERVIIIAEAGINHNGDLNKAIDLINKAADAKVDFVKFQTFKTEKSVTKKAYLADYQSHNLNHEFRSQYEMLKTLELSKEDHLALLKECEKRGIQFLSTAFDPDGIDFLDSLGVPFFKSPSGEITNYPYLKRLAEKKKPVILSTGMANMDDIKTAVKILTSNGLSKDEITILHCNTEYPTPMSDVNLKAMNNIKKELNIKVGYSDHTMGIEVPIAAVTLGASIIEKHFTLDRKLPGPDHKASLEPNELKDMVLSIRNIEKALSGSGIKEVSESEKKNIKIARKSIHVLRPLRKGDVIKEIDIIPLRPANGISPLRWQEVIGKKVNRDLVKYEPLKDEYIEMD